MESISYRLNLRNVILEYIHDNFSSTCFNSKTYLGMNIINELGKGINVQGDNYKICESQKCNYDAALKLVLPSYSTEAELISLMICLQIIEKFSCPNLPILYYNGKCNDCIFTKRHKECASGCECMTIVTEFARVGDLESYLKKSEQLHVENMMFQIFAGLYTLYSNYGLVHNDLHSGNVLVHKTNKHGSWRYVVNGKSYILPNEGVLFTLWDFGFTTIPGIIPVDEDYIEDNSGYFIKIKNINNVDIDKITQAIIYYLNKVDKSKIKYVTDLVGYYDIFDVFDNEFTKFIERGNVSDIIDTYFTENYQPNVFFEQLSIEQIFSMRNRLTEIMWESIIVNRKNSVDEIKNIENSVDFGLLSKTIQNHYILDEYHEKLDWKDVSRWKKLGTEYIEKYIDKVDWDEVSRYSVLPIEFIEKHVDRLNIELVSRFQVLTFSFIYKYRDSVYWDYILDDKIEVWCTSQIIEVAEYLKWNKLTMGTRTPKSMIQLSKYIDWSYVSKYRKFTRKDIQILEQYLVSQYLTVNDSIDIKEVADVNPTLVDWKNVRQYTDQLLEKYARYIDWDSAIKYISETQFNKYVEYISTINNAVNIFIEDHQVSSSFILSNLQEIDISVLSSSQVLDSKIINKLHETLDWGTVKITKFSDRDIINYANKINWDIDENARKIMTVPLEVFAHVTSYINWDLCSKFIVDESMSIIVPYASNFDWVAISETINVSPDNLMYLTIQIDSIEYSVYTNFSRFETNDYTRFTGYIDWELVSEHAKLSSRQIRMFEHVLNLSKITISEIDWPFIRKHKDVLNWNDISKLELPELFAREFYNYLAPHIDI